VIIHTRHRDNLSIKPDDVTANKTVIFSHFRETFKPHVSIYCQWKQSIPYFLFTRTSCHERHPHHYVTQIDYPLRSITRHFTKLTGS